MGFGPPYPFEVCLRALARTITGRGARCAVRLDKAQALLLDRLGLRLPERLRIPSRIAKRKLG